MGLSRFKAKMGALLQMHNTPPDQCCYAASSWLAVTKTLILTASSPDF
jgi:hypothetical protein